MAYYKINGQKVPYSSSQPQSEEVVVKAPSNRVLEYGIAIALVALILILASRKRK